MTAGLSRNRPLRLIAGLPALALGLVLVSGCNLDGYSADMEYPVRDDLIMETRPTDNPPHFERPGQWAFLQPIFKEQGGKTVDPSTLTAEQRARFRTVLNRLFGTPAEPKVADIEESAQESLLLDNATLAEGSKLYRRHCLHCHGLSGDGRGPTAPWVNPHPRDYRPGMFKFTSTLGGNERKPSRADLVRTLKEGIEGTSMPSFGLLDEQKELRPIISYVIHLSLRGQVELNTMRELFSEQSQSADEIETKITDNLSAFVSDWLKAENEPIPVGKFLSATKQEIQESIERGYDLFLGKGVGAASCISCHVDYGRQNTYRYDDWGTIVRPRNLTQSVYRGGRRPVDLYYRIYKGINGAQMPAFITGGETPDEANKRTWDLVNFVQALPYPSMLPPRIQEAVYGTGKGSTEHVATVLPK